MANPQNPEMPGKVQKRRRVRPTICSALMVMSRWGEPTGPQTDNYSFTSIQRQIRKLVVPPGSDALSKPQLHGAIAQVRGIISDNWTLQACAGTRRLLLSALSSRLPSALYALRGERACPAGSPIDAATVEEAQRAAGRRHTSFRRTFQKVLGWDSTEGPLVQAEEKALRDAASARLERCRGHSERLLRLRADDATSMVVVTEWDRADREDHILLHAMLDGMAVLWQRLGLYQYGRNRRRIR